jgi:hypothetical protein
MMSRSRLLSIMLLARACACYPPSSGRPGDRALVQRVIWRSGLITAAVDLVVLKRRLHGMNTVIKKKHRRSDYLKVLKSIA